MLAIDLHDLLDPLADADGDADLVRQLAKGQYGKRMLRLRAKADQASAASAADFTPGRDWYALLARVQRADPEAFRTVMLDPDTAILLRDGRSYPGAVGQLAAAAAILASVPAAVVVPLTHGTLFLPAVGTVRIAADAAEAMVRVTAHGIVVTVGDASVTLPADLASSTSSWRPLCWLRTGKTARLKVRLAVDGPLNEAFSAQDPLAAASADMTPEDEREWQRALADAWQVLENEHPVQASAIAAGVRAIVPLPPGGNGGIRSGTLAGAFGAVAISRSSQPEFFAVTLVHEFQHGKLDAALDLIDLCDPDGPAVYYAPWRPDPRPVGALLQGVYAHLGVAHFWNAQRKRGMVEDALLAHVEFVRWRDDTWRACRELVEAPELTSAGRAFAGKLLAQLERLRAEGAPEEACRLAGLLAVDQSVSWRLRNLEVDPQAARGLADAWLGAGKPTELPASCVQRRAVPRDIPDERIRLLYRSIAGLKAENTETISVADRHFILGDYGAARDAYGTRVAEDPGDLAAWVGLAVAAAAREDTVHAILTEKPELVAEVYRQAACAAPGPRNPQHLAEWLCSC